MKTGQIINVSNDREPIYEIPTVQTTGESTSDIMSQKAVTDKFTSYSTTEEMNATISTAITGALEVSY